MPCDPLYFSGNLHLVCHCGFFILCDYHAKYWLAPNNIHFNREGSAFLGWQVAGAIMQELEKLELQKCQQSPDKFTVPGKL
jgi:hypothetical protein